MRDNRIETIKEGFDLFKVKISNVKENDVTYQQIDLYCNDKCIASNERVIEIDNEKHIGVWI